MEDVFVDIYRRRAWGEDCESVSGPGSSLERTSAFRDSLLSLFKELKVKTLLDAGCGDFNWMKLICPELDHYLGIDVVPHLIAENQDKYGSSTREFLHLNLVKDPLSRADLILSRDCLVHLTFPQILSALRNFKASGSTYLLTTTFLSVAKNQEIATGEWRPLNLQAPPFNFPKPHALVDEKLDYDGGVSAEKYLGLWLLNDIFV